MKKGISNQTLMLLAISALLILAFKLGSDMALFDFGINDSSEFTQTEKQNITENYGAGTLEKFDYLKVQRSSTCSLQPATVEAYDDDDRIQGSCCSPMDLHRYQEQIEGLKVYSDIPQIPKDPYDISASLAKELFGYQKDIQLSSEEQAVYDEAMEMSDEGGPCCCKCWRWHAFEGQAKFLITQHGWDSQQIAELWDLQDGCGGPGHNAHG